MDDVICPNCGESIHLDGYALETEWDCCGNYLPTGECCAAIYGTDRLVPVQFQVPCHEAQSR